MIRSWFASAVLVGVFSTAVTIAGCGDKQVPPGGSGTGDDDSGETSSSSGSSSSSPSSSGTSSGSSSGHGSSSGSSGGHASSGSSSGSSTSSGSSSSSSGGAVLDAAPPPPYDGGPQTCGVQPGAPDCYLKTSTCCVNATLTGQCVPHGQSCQALYAGFSCLGAIDCDPGSVCCGVANSTEANTACQAVAPGACAPTTSSATMGAAQLCVTSAECPSGVDCIAQTCLGNSNFRLCGLHSEAPFNCTATP